LSYIIIQHSRKSYEI